jgi:hypothetical protein
MGDGATKREPARRTTFGFEPLGEIDERLAKAAANPSHWAAR